MKKFVAATALLILSSATGFAADLPVRTFTKAPAYVAPVYNWTGFYVGAHIGGAFNGSNDEITGLTRSSNGGFLGGGQIGADYQFAPNWVVGVEGQISGLDYKRSYNNGTGGFVQEKTDWLASITGRLGYTWGAGLIYAKGGVAFRDNGGFSTSFTDTGARRDSTGYTVGGGLEYMFAPAWSAKLEYQYYNFDRTDFYRISTGATLASINSEIHTVKAGVNYHFNWGGPVVAKY